MYYWKQGFQMNVVFFVLFFVFNLFIVAFLNIVLVGDCTPEVGDSRSPMPPFYLYRRQMITRSWFTPVVAKIHYYF